MANENKKAPVKNAKTQDASEAEAADPVAGQDLGVAPKNFTGTEPPVREREDVHTFMPGKDWTTGVTLTGRFLRTRRVFSDKYSNPKYDTQGRPYRDIHEFEDSTNGKRFNIWGSIGMLDQRVYDIPNGAVVAITYTGQQKVEGVQGIPHTFKFILEEGKTWARRENPVEIDESQGKKFLPQDARAGNSSGANAH
jgi:hypothetical protein